jgi:excisionase family DNA binding protein
MDSRRSGAPIRQQDEADLSGQHLDLEMLVERLSPSALLFVIAAATRRLQEELPMPPAETSSQPMFMTVDEAAEYLTVSGKTVRRWKESGRLIEGIHWHKAGRRVLISRDALHAGLLEGKI